jgi:hypothetical protein
MNRDPRAENQKGPKSSQWPLKIFPTGDVLHPEAGVWLFDWSLMNCKTPSGNTVTVQRGISPYYFNSDSSVSSYNCPYAIDQLNLLEDRVLNLLLFLFLTFPGPP